MKKMKFEGKTLEAYRINENGEIFYGRFNRKQNYFMHQNNFYIKLFIDHKEVITPLLDLILSNYQDKPQHGEYKAIIAQPDFSCDFPLRVSGLVWKKESVSMKAKIDSISTDSLKNMRCVFIKGIAVGLLASNSGKIYDLKGCEKKPKINRFGTPIIEADLPYGLGKASKKLVDIIAESYLLPYKDSILNYHFSYLDKNKKNCASNNILMWKEGSSGVAIKKTVRVFKDGKFFGIFDSVSTCATILNIPRRTVSKMLKGELLQGFQVQEIKLF